MSNEIVLARFPNGDIFFTGYHGCSSTAHEFIFEKLDQIYDDAFADTEYDKFCSNESKSYEDVRAFEHSRASMKYEDIQTIELFTPYAGGSLWSARASRAGRIIVSGLSNIESDGVNAVDFQDRSNWPDWVLKLGVPATHSLLRSQWIEQD